MSAIARFDTTHLTAEGSLQYPHSTESGGAYVAAHGSCGIQQVCREREALAQAVGRLGSSEGLERAARRLLLWRSGVEPWAFLGR
jgi:hypothetical protein